VVALVLTPNAPADARQHSKWSPKDFLTWCPLGTVVSILEVFNGIKMQSEHGVDPKAIQGCNAFVVRYAEIVRVGMHLSIINIRQPQSILDTRHPQKNALSIET